MVGVKWNSTELTHTNQGSLEEGPDLYWCREVIRVFGRDLRKKEVKTTLITVLSRSKSHVSTGHNFQYNKQREKKKNCLERSEMTHTHSVLYVNFTSKSSELHFGHWHKSSSKLHYTVTVLHLVWSSSLRRIAGDRESNRYEERKTSWDPLSNGPVSLPLVKSDNPVTEQLGKICG